MIRWGTITADSTLSLQRGEQGPQHFQPLTSKEIDWFIFSVKSGRDSQPVATADMPQALSIIPVHSVLSYASAQEPEVT